VLRREPPLNLARAVRRLQRARATAAVPAGAGAAGSSSDTSTTVSPSTGASRAASTGASRRRRLWELSPRALDMVLGVGLPHEALRRVARRVLRGEPRAQGHELHAGLVSECRRRGPMAEALQDELERRHAPALRLAAALNTGDALTRWWQGQVGRHELPGALWAALSHARCTPALEQRVLGEVQMLQFQAGQATRVELARFEALIDENAVLTRVLAEAQARCSALMAEHARERDAHLAEAAVLRGRVQALEQALAQALQQVPSGKAQPGREARLAAHASLRLAQQAADPAAHREAHRATHLVAEQGARHAVPSAARAAAPQPWPAASTPDPAAPDSATAMALDQRKVLCVGGRTASVPVYRRLVEACGGRFLHHDGGEQDKLGQLDATLAAADLVICQAGCVSHNAYWRVKDHCKRTGKRCVFVETPSAAGLQRALAKIGT